MTGSPAGSIEREVKLKADLALELPDLRDVVGDVVGLPELELRTVYFDTPDHRLWHRGVSIRHRRGEGTGEGVWTLKLPTLSTGLTLDRTELDWSGPASAVPEPATRLVRGLVRRSTLVQVAELVSTRRRFVLDDGDGPWGELDDDTVTVLGGIGDGRRFRQIELELHGGGGDAARTVVDRLEAAGARRGGEPKLALALGPAGTPASRMGQSPGPRSSLGEVVRWVIGQGLDRMLDHDPGLRIEPGCPSRHHVHQARVATRRLRSDLQTFRAALDPLWVDHIRTDLKWFGGLLGALRDLDIISTVLDPAGASSSAESEGRDELGARLNEQRWAAAGGLDRALEADRYLNMLDRLDAAASAPPFRGSQMPWGSSNGARPADRMAAAMLPRMVRPSWRSLRRKVRSTGPHPGDAHLHRIRIRAKRLRYASEAAGPVIGQPALRTAAGAEELQEFLGAFHDAVTAETWLRREALSGTTEAGFAAGVLVGRQQHRQQDLRRRWRAAWKPLARKRRRRWLMEH